MPKENIHYPQDGLTKVVLNYEKKTGQITDANGDPICTWEDLKPFPIQSAKPAIPLPVRQSPLGDIIRLKEAGFTTEQIIQLNQAKAY